MTINGHLLLLVVASGLFVRLWSTNDRQRPPAVGRTPNRVASTMPPPQPIAADRDIPAHVVSTISRGDSSQEEVWTAATCPIPLPAGIDAGTFRVVDDTGRVARLVLSERESVEVAGPQTGAADLQTMTLDSRRWYFIRLQTPVARTTDTGAPEVGTIVPPVSADEVSVRTACANRKFDFTGFDAQTESGAVVSQKEFRPESPALPTAE